MAPALTPGRAGLAAAVVALGGGALALNRLLVGVFYDDGLYAGLALALARGEGYAHLHLPGAPAAVHFPPLYPAVLAPLFAALPLSAAAVAAKVLNLALAATAAGLVAWHAARTELLGPGAPRALAPVVVAAAALAIPVLATQGVLFAEPLFAVLLAATVILADRDRWTWAGVAAALVLLTRSIGVAAGAGVVLFALAVRRVDRRRAAMGALPLALAALGWGAWVRLHHRDIDPALALNYGSYGEVLSQTGLGALGGSDLPRPLGALTLAWLRDVGDPVFYLFGAAALSVGMYGLWLFARRSAAGLTLVCYLAILAVWPYPPDRFLWAVLPWIALAWTAGALALWGRPRLRLPLTLVAAAVAGGYGVYEARGLAGRWWEGAARLISANFVEILPALDSLPPSPPTVVASDNEPLVWLYTARHAVPLYLYAYRGGETIEPTPPEHRAYLERHGVTHVLLANPSAGSGRQLRALLNAYPGWLVAVRPWPGGRWLFSVRRER